MLLYTDLLLIIKVCVKIFKKIIQSSDLGDFKSFHVVENVSGFPNFKKLFLQLPNGACFAGTIREQLTSGDNTSNIIGYKVNENYGAYILMSVTEVRQYKISGGTIILVGKYLTDSDLSMLGGIQSLAFTKIDAKRVLLYAYTDSAKNNGFRIDFNGNAAANHIIFSDLTNGSANEIFRK